MDRNLELLPWGAGGAAVALRKESVDRNNIGTNYHVRIRQVALRKESVDRNFLHPERFRDLAGRSPQGERG